MYNRQVLVTTIKDLVKELEKYDENMEVYVSGCNGYLYVDEENGFCSFDDSYGLIADSDEYCDEIGETFYFKNVSIGNRYYELLVQIDEDGEDIIDEEDILGCTLPKLS